MLMHDDDKPQDATRTADYPPRECSHVRFRHRHPLRTAHKVIDKDLGTDRLTILCDWIVLRRWRLSRTVFHQH